MIGFVRICKIIFYLDSSTMSTHSALSTISTTCTNMFVLHTQTRRVLFRCYNVAHVFAEHFYCYCIMLCTLCLSLDRLIWRWIYLNHLKRGRWHGSFEKKIMRPHYSLYNYSAGQIDGKSYHFSFWFYEMFKTVFQTSFLRVISCDKYHIWIIYVPNLLEFSY